MPTTANSQIITCPNCGAKNRVAADKLGQGLTPRCGKCHEPLPQAGGATGGSGAHDEVVTVSDATFAAEIERSTVPVVVDMWAPWCGPCRMLAPILDQLASEMAGRVKFAKLNIDENPATASRFQISSIPALVVFKAGREVDRLVGVQPKPVIAQRLQRHIT